MMMFTPSKMALGFSIVASLTAESFNTERVDIHGDAACCPLELGAATLEYVAVCMSAGGIIPERRLHRCWCGNGGFSDEICKLMRSSLARRRRLELLRWVLVVTPVLLHPQF
eukprot:Blabericola_migrator_1__8717@NODE_4595_length_1067_cov_209_146000_g2854_i0_p1_GENE_NODE_4595_length_1067_cov_209_146000_g2854_i0NODE_4595_length_1067_cov_209_146000_g2854_i0_p1_ORF_typecomplete_len112_score12_75_NODE_4595_length_1067_cov_209_146000_g2854_i0389724